MAINNNTINIMSIAINMANVYNNVCHILYSNTEKMCNVQCNVSIIFCDILLCVSTMQWLFWLDINVVCVKCNV